jgi:hypothetical protein
VRRWEFDQCREGGGGVGGGEKGINISDFLGLGVEQGKNDRI